MGTPVREIIEVRRKEVEKALLGGVAECIKGGSIKCADELAGLLAAFKAGLYDAYTGEKAIRELDLMGFSLDEVKIYRHWTGDAVVVELPNGRSYKIKIEPKPTYEMQKGEFEKYTAMKAEVMAEATKIAEQMRQEEERKQLEARAKELEEKVKGLEGTVKELREKYNTLAEFIRAKGLQEEFVKYVAEKRRQEEEEEE